ncbi:MAG: heavy-metal-associated domain-containing protein [Planctomycetaceae bacterium]
MKHEVAISGMHCQSCVGRVTKVLEAIPEVQQAAVSLKPPMAKLDLNQTVKLSALRKAVKSVGDYDITQKPEPEQSWFVTYFPLLLIVGFIAGGTAILAMRADRFSEANLMSDFMGLFFVVFSFFKLLDLRGFARAFRTYDLIAEQSRAYAGLYPFIELTLGVLYLGRWFPMPVNFVTLVLMLIGSFGVIGAIKSNRKIQCACLGTVFKLPMSKVTLIENLTMAVMAMMVLFRLVI